MGKEDVDVCWEGMGEMKGVGKRERGRLW